MRRTTTTLGLLILLLLPAWSAIGATPASATKCFKVVPTVKNTGATTDKRLYGDWEDSNCKTSGGTRAFVLAETWQYWWQSVWTLRSGTNKEVCTQAEAQGTGWFSNYTCTNPVEGFEGLNRYTLVYAEPGWSGISVVKAASASKPEFNIKEKKITCSTATGGGPASSAKTVKVITLKYSGCEASSKESVTISNAEYDLWAGDALGITGKPVVITFPTANCSVKLVTGGNNKNLEPVIYAEDSVKETATTAFMSVKGINAEGSGGACAGTSTNGSYNGELELSEEGTTIKDEITPTP